MRPASASRVLFSRSFFNYRLPPASTRWMIAPGARRPAASAGLTAAMGGSSWVAPQGTRTSKSKSRISRQAVDVVLPASRVENDGGRLAVVKPYRVAGEEETMDAVIP